MKEERSRDGSVRWKSQLWGGGGREGGREGGVGILILNSTSADTSSKQA